MSDSLPTATRVSDPGIRALYRLENRWQAWLDVEVALARAQAELGVIPPDAAEAIARAARMEKLDRARIDEGLARTGHTIVPTAVAVTTAGLLTYKQHLSGFNQLQVYAKDKSQLCRYVQYCRRIGSMYHRVLINYRYMQMSNNNLINYVCPIL